MLSRTVQISNSADQRSQTVFGNKAPNNTLNRQVSEAKHVARHVQQKTLQKQDEALGYSLETCLEFLSEVRH